MKNYHFKNIIGVKKYYSYLKNKGLTHHQIRKQQKIITTFCQELHNQFMQGTPIYLPYALGILQPYYSKLKFKLDKKNQPVPANRFPAGNSKYFSNHTLKNFYIAIYKRYKFPTINHRLKPAQQGILSILQFKFTSKLRKKLYTISDELSQYIG